MGLRGEVFPPHDYLETLKLLLHSVLVFLCKTRKASNTQYSAIAAGFRYGMVTAGCRCSQVPLLIAKPVLPESCNAAGTQLVIPLLNAHCKISTASTAPSLQLFVTALSLLVPFLQTEFQITVSAHFISFECFLKG